MVVCLFGFVGYVVVCYIWGVFYDGFVVVEDVVYECGFVYVWVFDDCYYG